VVIDPFTAHMRVRCVAASVAAAFALSCGSLGQPQVPTGRPVTCPRLDSRLFQLAQANDSETFAKNSGLELRSTRVRVVIELREGAPVPTGYDAVIDGRFGRLVDAWVAIGQLCSLAEHQDVSSVRPPDRLQPLGTAP
jgi:hypothetical protein